MKERNGIMRVQVRGDMATAYYTAYKRDGLWFVELREVTVNRIPVDSEMTTGEEMDIRKQIERELAKEMIYGT
jgi:hypothetical protein